MKLGLRFGLPDFREILERWPQSLFNYWQAYYLLEPWDMANSVALAECKYKPPDFYRARATGRRRLSGANF